MPHIVIVEKLTNWKLIVRAILSLLVRIVLSQHFEVLFTKDRCWACFNGSPTILPHMRFGQTLYNSDPKGESDSKTYWCLNDGIVSFLQEGIMDSSPPPVARTLSSSCLILNLIKVLRGVIISLSLLFGISSSFPSPSSSQVPQPTCSWKCIPARCMSVGEPDYHPVARPDASPRPRHFCFDQCQVRPRGEGPHHKVWWMVSLIFGPLIWSFHQPDNREI